MSFIERKRARLGFGLQPGENGGGGVHREFPVQDRTPEIDMVGLSVLVRNLQVFYRGRLAIQVSEFGVPENQITAIIGASGCGKSTLLRSINRMNELVKGSRTEGEVWYRGNNLYNPFIDPVEVRRRIGMVFQSPNPFPKSIYDAMKKAAG